MKEDRFPHVDFSSSIVRTRDRRSDRRSWPADPVSFGGGRSSRAARPRRRGRTVRQRRRSLLRSGGLSHGFRQEGFEFRGLSFRITFQSEDRSDSPPRCRERSGGFRRRGRRSTCGFIPGRGGRGYSRPRSTKETHSASPTTRWSSTRTSTMESASTSCSVRSRSVWLGSATPEGWLWAKITAAALRLRERRDHFARVHGRAVDGAAEHFLELDDAVAVVEEETREHLEGQVPELRHQEARGLVRGGERVAAVEPGREVAPAELEAGLELDVARRPEARQPAEVLPVEVQQPAKASRGDDRVAGDVHGRPAPGPRPHEQGHELRVGERLRAPAEQLLTRPLRLRPVLDPRPLGRCRLGAFLQHVGVALVPPSFARTRPGPLGTDRRARPGCGQVGGQAGGQAAALAAARAATPATVSRPSPAPPPATAPRPAGRGPEARSGRLGHPPPVAGQSLRIASPHGNIGTPPPRRVFFSPAWRNRLAIRGNS